MKPNQANGPGVNNMQLQSLMSAQPGGMPQMPPQQVGSMPSLQGNSAANTIRHPQQNLS